MKKTLVATSVALAFTSGVANAAFLLPGSTGTIELNSGCFTFGNCAIDGSGPDDITDNAITVSDGVNTYGTGIAGDGLVGSIGFTVGADGNTLTITSFQQDTYTGTAGGDFAIDYSSLAGMSGYISDDGDVTFDPTGRTGIAAFYAFSLGIQPWNIDNAASIVDPNQTGLYDKWTTGSDSAISPGPSGGNLFTVTGSALTSSGAGEWTGVLVSAGNVGSSWGFFDGNPFSEKFNITVKGTAVPVPAAVWLFGSGLLGLVGVARRRKA